jgi:hypothetical protein
VLISTLGDTRAEACTEDIKALAIFTTAFLVMSLSAVTVFVAVADIEPDLTRVAVAVTVDCDADVAVANCNSPPCADKVATELTVAAPSMTPLTYPASKYGSLTYVS